MQNKKLLIRLVVYLIVALLLIVLLWVMSKETEPKPKSKEEKVIEEGIPVDLPNDTESLIKNPHINIDIDSNNIYYLNDIKIEWNELVDSITVQQEKEPKLSILLCVDKKAKAGYVAKVLEIVKEKNMKVGISTKID